MNRVIVSGVIFGAMIAGAVFSIVSVRQSTTEVIGLIDSVTEAYAQDDTEETEARIAELGKIWQENQKLLSMFVPSCELSDVSCGIAKLESLYRFGADDFTAECMSLRRRVELINESGQLFP